MSFINKKMDPDEPNYRRAIVDASNYLHHDLCKSFARTLSDLPVHKVFSFYFIFLLYWPLLCVPQELPSIYRVMAMAHREGINFRHLGRARKFILGERAAALNMLLLTECVARTVKNMVLNSK